MRRIFYFLLFITGCFFRLTAAHSLELTQELVPLDRLARTFVDDVNRVEVYYPQQFERLEMDWKKTSESYVSEFQRESNLERKLEIFARLYNSWNNAHHRPMTVTGVVKNDPQHVLELPVRIFGQGLKLSEAKFFISDISLAGLPADIKIGDEILSYNAKSIAEYVRLARDEQGAESPETHINVIARDMALQRRCRWGKLTCWSENRAVALTLRDAQTGATKKTTLTWRERLKGDFSAPKKTPSFAAIDKAWSFQTLQGHYGIDFDAVPDNEFGFFGILKNGTQKFLVIKMFQFKDLKFVQEAIREARKPHYSGVILDFADNGGGDDSAMTFTAGMLGTKYQLELSSIRLVREFKEFEVLKEATFGETKAKFVLPYVTDENLNKMSPLTPFACIDETCPLKTSFNDYLNYWDKPTIQSVNSISRIALITGRGTASKADSIAALFRATRAGPIVGTPAIGSSGTYYFRKEYQVQVGKNVVRVGVTFTPDFSIGTDCEVIQANPPNPDILIERTFENHQFYDTRSWIESAKAMMAWRKPRTVDRGCDSKMAQKRMQEFGLPSLARLQKSE